MIRLLACFLLLFGLALPSLAQSILERGEQLFNGSAEIEGAISIGGTQLAQPLARFACRTCHQRDGLGGSEANAPPITWDALTTPTASRRAYDVEAFRTALLEGRRAGGGTLDITMPRYAVSDDTLGGLIEYLTVLPSLQQRGIDAHHVTFGVAVPSDNTGPARRYLSLLRDAFSTNTSIFGREVHFIALEGSREAILKQADEGVAGVVGLVPSQEISADDFVREGVPVLFPLALLRGDEDPALVRGFMASQSAQLKKLLEHAAEQSRSVGVACLNKFRCAPPEDAGLATTRIVPGSSMVGLDSVVIVGNDETAALEIVSHLAPGMRVYGIAGELPGFAAAAQVRDVDIILADGYGVLEGGAEGLLERHARRAARLIATALASAGRAVSRNKLLAFFDRKNLPEFELDYRRYPLTGTESVRLLHMSQRR